MASTDSSKVKTQCKSCHEANYQKNKKTGGEKQNNRETLLVQNSHHKKNLANYRN